MAAKLITVYWRDIPAQVIAKKGRQTAKIELTQRFAEAIDMAAMRGGAADTEAYLEDWRKVPVSCSDDLEAEAKAAAEKLEAAYSDERLKSLYKAGGVDAEANPETPDAG